MWLSARGLALGTVSAQEALWSLYDLALPLTAFKSRALDSFSTPFTESHESPSLPCVLSW